MKQYLAIETFKPECMEKAYDRFHAQGRMLPDGLKYLDSWLEANGNRCFQLMETDSADLLGIWISRWADLVEFEIIELGEIPGPKN